MHPPLLAEPPAPPQAPAAARAPGLAPVASPAPAPEPGRRAAPLRFRRTFLASLLLHAAAVGVGWFVLQGASAGPADRTVRLEFRASAAETEAEEVPEEVVVQAPSDGEPLPAPLPAELPDLVPLEDLPPDLVPLLTSPEADQPPLAPHEAPVAMHLRVRPPPRPSPSPPPVVARAARPAPPALPRAAATPAPLRPLHVPRITAASYPAEALRLGVEGTVVVELTVEASGVVTAVRIHRSSGSPILDQDALVRAREFRFAPIPSVQRAHVPVRYRIT